MPIHPSKKAEQKMFKIAAYRLAAHRAFIDYKLANQIFIVEPEHFLDEWTARFVPGMYSEESKAFNKEFMLLLVEGSRRR
jgi:hypothetical protein